MIKKFWFASASLLALALAGSPRTAVAACLMDGSTCAAPKECCSNRCMVVEAGDKYGECVPLVVE